MTERDDSAIEEGLCRWLADRDPGRGAATVVHLDRPTAGYSSETILVEVTRAGSGPGDAAVASEHLVLRLAPASPSRATFADFDLPTQYEAQLAAASVGVPVADPVLETDPAWIGAPFIAMPHVEGHLIGPVAHLDQWLLSLDESSRCRLYTNLVAVVARVHRADPSLAPAVPRRDETAELDYWDRYLDWSTDSAPVGALSDALAWCRKHRPGRPSPPALLWGDVRFENVIFGDDLSPLAVLDWDMATVGSPEHDVAWFTGLDLTIHHLFGERLAGFPDRDETVALFEEETGRPVVDLEWYETLAMVRSAAVMTRIGVLRRAAGKPLLMPLDDNPLLDLLTSRLS